MLIVPPCVVTLTWSLADAQGRTIDELPEATEFLVGGSDLLEKVEQALLGKEPGHEAMLHLEPEHAFGDYKPELVCFEDRAIFPAQVEKGMAFEGLPPGSRTVGMPREVIYLVTEVYPSHVVLDGNHPLAGMALRLQLKVHGVRVATAEEIEAGSVASGPLTVFGTAPVSTPRLQ